MMDKIAQEAIGGFAMGVGAVAMFAPLVAFVFAAWAVHKLIKRIDDRRAWGEKLALLERYYSEIAAINRVLDDAGVDDLDQGQPLATARRVRLICEAWVREC